MALAALGVMIGLPVGLVGWSELRYARGKTRAEQAFRDERPPKLEALGTTHSLAILPLVDWFSARPGLRCEAGVSYLIKTDANTILMDVGLNLARTDPSPLLHNMRELGISLAEIDTIVLSHCHADHVGGLRWLRRRTFSLGNVQLDLRGKRVFAPEPLVYPGISPQCSRAPTVIGRGVATIGAIRAQIYLGRVDEQALAIRVSGKGIVLVVGCGHQSLPRILARARQLFDDPIYGVIGGLHYPLPRGRLLQLGLDLQNLLVYGPFDRPRQPAVDGDLALLANHSPRWVSLSAHDSSDEVIEDFRRVFGAAYHDLLVGDWQTVAAGMFKSQVAVQ
jgi:7,8-dihydropterin-6-yl-methyl-4-(beta-D-ribofuranosyl)aminobenzene 5'-phosphate synthase